MDEKSESMKPFCEVIINTCTSNPIGTIYGLENHIPFNPTTILTELNYKREVPDINNCQFDSFDYNYEHAFLIPLKIDNPDQYTHVVQTIRKFLVDSFQNHTVLDIYKIDFLKSYFNITFQLTTSKHIPNKMKRFAETAPDTILVPFCYETYSLDSALNYHINECDEFFYECYSMSDLIYSILHFLAINKYKIAQCPHCERLFATQTYKQKYCSRNSRYPNYEHLNCEQAVRNISKKISRNYQSIYNNLQTNYWGEHLDTFYTQCQPTIDSFKQKPTHENIATCFNLLDKNKWYTKDIGRMIGKRNPPKSI